MPLKAGGPWRYRTAAAPDDWATTTFDDSSWQQGTAPLGYGTAPLTTTIDGGPPGKRRITTYFRTTAVFDDPFFFDTLVMRLRRDDGAVVYVNGKEVYRVNLPAGPIGPNTPATRDVTGVERGVFFPVKLDPAAFDAGKNEIAVELHQPFGIVGGGISAGRLRRAGDDVAEGAEPRFGVRVDRRPR